MSITVGPIQSYGAGSSWFNLRDYSQLGISERVAVDLVASDLWLLDSSNLYLTEDYAPRIAFLNEGAGYRSPVNISATGNTNGKATVFANLSGYNSILPSKGAPLSVGDWVQLSEIQGGTQLNFSVIPNGVSQPNRTPLSTDSKLNPTSPYNPNGPVFWTAYADPNKTIPLIILGYEDILGAGSDNDFNDGLLILDVGQKNFEAIFAFANLGQDSTINLGSARSVPIEDNSTLGLIVVASLLVGKNAVKHLSRLSQKVRTICIPAVRSSS
jgi:hypothetical protein